MLPIQIVLLFRASPTLEPNSIAENLKLDLATAGHKLEGMGTQDGRILAFRTDRMAITVSQKSHPLTKIDRKTATSSPLCRKVMEPLNSALDTHLHHLVISFENLQGHKAPDPLHKLRLAHRVAGFLANLTCPVAVFWRQSNLLLTGNQYRGMAGLTTPWPLFAQLSVNGIVSVDDDRPTLSVTIENADEFVGAPIRILATNSTLDTACVAALSFLRHSVQSDIPLRDGQVFGTEPDMLYQLSIQPPNPDYPSGIFQLSEVNGQSETVPSVPARTLGTTPIQSAQFATSDTSKTTLARPIFARKRPDEDTPKGRALLSLMSAIGHRPG